MGDTWKDGRRAWERLGGWDDTGSPARSGEAALHALADIGTVRRLLDQAELGAVKAARAQKKSWAEIATRLGVTRQSAWERWRDLDETPAPQPDPLPAALEAADIDLATQVVRRRERRRRYPTEVPDVIGMNWKPARQMMEAKGLDVRGIDPDGLTLTESDLTDGVVTDQSPKPGAVVTQDTEVTVWIGRGGGSAGDREPRRPLPPSLPATKSRVARRLKYSSPTVLEAE